MPVVSLNHFNLRADRRMTARLLEFYVDVVGLSAGWRPPFPFPGHWLYAGDQPVVHLVEDDGAGESPPRAGTLDHVAFICTGAAAFEAHLRCRGLPFRRSGVPGTRLQQIFINDPSGNGVELNFADG